MGRLNKRDKTTFFSQIFFFPFTTPALPLQRANIFLKLFLLFFFTHQKNNEIARKRPNHFDSLCFSFMLYYIEINRVKIDVGMAKP